MSPPSSPVVPPSPATMETSDHPNEPSSHGAAAHMPALSVCQPTPSLIPPDSASSSWTPINRPRSVSPPARSAASHQHHREITSRHEQMPKPRTPLLPESEHGQVPSNRRSARTPEEPQTAGKPTTSRQDSAVSPVVTHPVTPPPDHTSTQSQSSHASTDRITGHDRHTGPSSSYYHQDDDREHLSSYENPHPPSPNRLLPPGGQVTPLPHETAVKEPISSMGPPPTPSLAPVSTPQSEASGNLSHLHTVQTSSLKHASRNDAQHNNLEKATNLASSPQIPSFMPTRRQSPEATSTEKEFRKNRPPEMCAHCHSVWTYPPMAALQAPRPSQTSLEYERAYQAILDNLSDYAAKKNADYNEWTRCHRVEPGCQVPPCMASLEPISQSNHKRKPEAPPDDSHVANKLRKLSCDALSPQPSQLTPPPEPGTTPLAQQPLSGGLFYKSEGGAKIQVTEQLGTLLRVEGAPPPQYEPPADDESNMWIDPARKRKREIKQEEIPIKMSFNLENRIRKDETGREPGSLEQG